MLRATVLIFVVLFTIQYKAEAKSSAFLLSQDLENIIIELEGNLNDTVLIKNSVFKKKLTAISLAIALGPLGMHRLYLGTDFRVPVVYSITLGAFGVLPLIDIIAILSTKDLSKYENNPKIMMWVE